jgi:hypothetical protein
VLVRFLSGKRREIVTGFVGLIPVQEATGEKNIPFDEEIKIRCKRLANCIGFTTDGVSNKVGCNTSVRLD